MLPMHLWGPRALKIQCLASIEGPDGLSAAAAPRTSSRSPNGTPRDGDNFTTLENRCCDRQSRTGREEEFKTRFQLSGCLFVCGEANNVGMPRRVSPDNSILSFGDGGHREQGVSWSQPGTVASSARCAHSGDASSSSMVHSTTESAFITKVLFNQPHYTWLLETPKSGAGAVVNHSASPSQCSAPWYSEMTPMMVSQHWTIPSIKGL
ncbi:hypothetical protein EYF80_010013 [Liparis tanakae]|uniref:Uncharacterized protein n=1 Tax=Liparis tanakae TaxID=230148 RepID=A0A4Z2IP32_9TELE|nr:hypothetical protein EYF80_010013 [Liparis tanakae]